MGSITSTIDTAFRDYEVADDPTSGPNDPVKAQVRAMGPLIEYAIARAGLGALVSDAKATAAELSLVPKDGAVALVYADPDDAQNDLWLKVGDPGEGEWENTGSLHSIMDALGLPYVEGAAEAATEAAASAGEAQAIATQLPITAQAYVNQMDEVLQDVTAIAPTLIIGQVEPTSERVVLWFKEAAGTNFASLMIRDAPFQDTAPPVAISDTEPVTPEASLWFRTNGTDVATLFVKEIG